MVAVAPFRLRVVDRDELPSLDEPLSAMRDGAYGGLLVPGLFSADEMAGAVARLEQAPQLRHRLFAESAIEFIGRPLQWSSADRSAYLGEVPRLAHACTQVVGESTRLLERIYDTLALVARRPVRVFSGAAGSYAPATLRRIPPGEQVGAHFELGQLESASYGELTERIATTTLFSFYLMMRAPEQGGELAVYDLRRDDEDASRVRSADTVEGPLLGRYPPTLIASKPGDLLVFDSGRHAHRVVVVGGAHARWTAGGLLAFAKDGDEVFAWA